MLADPQARPHASLGSMFAVAVSTPAFVRTRISRATRAPARRTSRVVVRAAGSDGNAEDEDDLPPPIKLTADQARIAALAFEVLYEKDPREDMEEMLKDKERPGLRAKLQQAIKGAFASPFLARPTPCIFFYYSVLFLLCKRRLAKRNARPRRQILTRPNAHLRGIRTQLRTRRARTVLPWSAPPPGRRWTAWKMLPCAPG